MLVWVQLQMGLHPTVNRSSENVSKRCYEPDIGSGMHFEIKFLRDYTRCCVWSKFLGEHQLGSAFRT